MDALSKECEGIKCDRDVALLALKQSVALKGEHEREQMEDLKVHLHRVLHISQHFSTTPMSSLIMFSIFSYQYNPLCTP